MNLSPEFKGSMKINRNLANSFDQMGSAYDKGRVGYPEKLIKDIITYANISEKQKILDVGCGSGQVAILFGKRGFNVTGIDISPTLLNIAKKKCKGYLVNFLSCSFENTGFPPPHFSVIVSGLAWHWINPKERYEKAYNLLNKNGTLALFWSYQEYETPFLKAVSFLFDRYQSRVSGPKNPLMKDYANYVYEELAGHKLFKDVTKKEYFINYNFTPAQYRYLILSYSWVSKLTEKDRKEFIDDFNLLFKKFGKNLPIPYAYTLILAKKK